MLQPSTELSRHILLRCRTEQRSVSPSTVHAYMRKYGFETHNSLGNNLVLTLIKVTKINSAQQVFDQLEYRDELSWNSLISGYVKWGNPDQALALHQALQEEGSVQLNEYTYVALLSACTKKKDLQKGLKIHAEVAQSGLLQRDPFVSSTLLDMYIKCGSLANAQELFDDKVVNDVVSWTSLITAYVKQGHHKEALYNFEKMQEQSVLPDAITFLCTLKACGSIGTVDKGRLIHAEIEKQGLLQNDGILGTALVDMYAKCGFLGKAKETFDKLPLQNVVSWNAFISGFVKHGFGSQALDYFDEMQSQNVLPDVVSFICALKACAITGNITKGEEIHEEVERQGLLEADVVVGTAIIDMYAKWGRLDTAQQLFDLLPVRNIVSWNALIAGYIEHGFGEDALDCVEKMHHEGVAQDAVTFACSLKACANVGTPLKGQETHAEIARRGMLEKDPVVGNSLVDMYGKCGWLTKAQEVFDNLSVKSVVSWNALISGNVEHGHDKEAIKCYVMMRKEGFLPDSVTLVCCLKACANVGDTIMACELHDEVVQKDLMESDIDVGNTLVDMYAKFGCHLKAQQIFDSLPVRDIVSWNAVLVGYAKHGHGKEALQRFEQMQLECVLADAISLGASLKACASIRALRKGQELHCKIQKGIHRNDHVIGTALVDLYAKCGLLDKAQLVFDNLPHKDAASWNALISGYADQGCGEDALKCFEQMEFADVSPNSITLLCSLKACGSAKDTAMGLKIHAEISRRNLLDRDLVGNTLVDMYAKCGMIVRAQEVFNELPARDVVSWTVLIAGLVEHGFADEALNRFWKMQHKGVCPNIVSFVFGLKACASMGATDKGQEIHAELERLGFLRNNLVVSNALIDMYAKSGLVAVAQQVFDNLPSRGVASFNSLIAGYAHSGKNACVFLLLDRMVGEGLIPDGVTFIVILNACCQSSLFDKGQTHFEAMSKDYGIVPSLQHHTCLVDLLVRAGDLDKATELVKKLPFCPDYVLWLSMLGACGKLGNRELGRHAFERAVCLNEKDAAPYVLFSHI
ncbi:hypothetical protein GOP47_0023174 [Adiantum capillus-veneris]|uniref:Pentatricopeptide repeat-containing protein n=1 Tax=Adiantum capillus-veneris TaxID=13818 RepID=A0A9D4Z694_ADICA|nr:hypothetical protein GOP47_0023174 [Adiantum capillus-veneris]